MRDFFEHSKKMGGGGAISGDERGRLAMDRGGELERDGTRLSHIFILTKYLEDVKYDYHIIHGGVDKWKSAYPQPRR